MLFTGNANPALGRAVAKHLHVPLGKAVVERFSDGEIMVEIRENVRGRDAYVLQPTCAPTNDNFMELLVLVDALRRASAQSITAVIPYLGYARQDRRPRSTRVPITAKLVANMITSVGTDRVLTLDLHAEQIQGFFDIPIDNVYASPVLLGDMVIGIRYLGRQHQTIVLPAAAISKFLKPLWAQHFTQRIRRINSTINNNMSNVNAFGRKFSVERLA